ncbi:hypothetical protein L596_021332 [Steinernema carpocapsae]|uniref:Uncharacterized protein n=1 Tax=Steinernema carpocapsae TaxID=34508 RepID=A0A4U5MIH3_STECR|nr:hypothetical protein L596_021332 [Steinernema carpocapsae]
MASLELALFVSAAALPLFGFVLCCKKKKNSKMQPSSGTDGPKLVPSQNPVKQVESCGISSNPEAQKCSGSQSSQMAIPGEPGKGEKKPEAGTAGATDGATAQNEEDDLRSPPKVPPKPEETDKNDEDDSTKTDLRSLPSESEEQKQRRKEREAKNGRPGEGNNPKTAKVGKKDDPGTQDMTTQGTCEEGEGGAKKKPLNEVGKSNKKGQFGQQESELVWEFCVSVRRAVRKQPRGCNVDGLRTDVSRFLDQFLSQFLVEFEVTIGTLFNHFLSSQFGWF